MYSSYNRCSEFYSYSSSLRRDRNYIPFKFGRNYLTDRIFVGRLSSQHSISYILNHWRFIQWHLPTYVKEQHLFSAYNAFFVLYQHIIFRPFISTYRALFFSSLQIKDSLEVGMAFWIPFITFHCAPPLSLFLLSPQFSMQNIWLYSKLFYTQGR